MEPRDKWKRSAPLSNRHRGERPSESSPFQWSSDRGVETSARSRNGSAAIPARSFVRSLARSSASSPWARAGPDNDPQRGPPRGPVGRAARTCINARLVEHLVWSPLHQTTLRRPAHLFIKLPLRHPRLLHARLSQVSWRHHQEQHASGQQQRK